ncbi:MAG: hypothetical protein Q9212_006497 [Teloschistes hypoglaucus]
MTPVNTIREEVPFALVPTVPVMKFHGTPFFYMSESGMTQQEYQKNFLAKRCEHCSSDIEKDDDDVVILKCPDREDGTGRHFLFKRSVLRRSPVFAEFFNSPHYLHGCNMLLTFMVDPAVCFDIMYKYLNDGADMYEQTILRVQLTMRYQLVDRLIILVRLYALAQKMRLPILTAMALGILNDPDTHISASECVTISSLVFAPLGGFDHVLRDWCFEHVKDNYDDLKPSFLWHETMWKTDVELPRRWSNLVEETDARLYADSNNTIFQHVKSPSTSPPLGNTPSTNEAQDYQDLIDQVLQQQAEEGTSSDGELSVDMPPYQPNRGNAGKIAQLLGTSAGSPPNRPRYSTASAMPAFSPEFNKAHSVMGFDLPAETPRRVQPSRRRFSISSFAPSLTPTRAGQRFVKWAAS